MNLKKIAKKICAAVTAGIIGFTFAYSPVLTPTVAEAAAKGKAEQALEEYMSSHSLKELNTTSEGQLAIYNYMREKYGVSSDPNKTARLNSMMTELTNAVAAVDPTIHDLPYVYFVNTDKSFNAFCSFAHVMSVNSGAFDLVANDDELATIIGHEMGHGQKEHAYKGTKKTQQKVMWANVAAAAIGGGAVTNVLGSILLNQSVVQGNIRYEKEADNLAFEYIVNTNYNPGACAAIWQRVIDKYGTTAEQSTAEMFFNPSDHPNHLARRDKYIKKLNEYSGKHVSVNDNGMVTIDKKDFIIPAALANDSMSSMERACFVLGNLAKAYHNGQNKYDATVSNGTVYLGNQPIITPVSGDESAQTIADRLNEIK